MMNEETKASLNRFLKQREERIKNMTLAEARDIVSSIYGHSDMRMESDKALQMILDCADKTLEQETVEELKSQPTDGDLISREDAINVAIDTTDDWDGGHNIGRADMIVKAFKNMPLVKPKKGKWIKEKGYLLVYRCSNCKKFVYSRDSESDEKFEDLSRLDSYKYCPHCGAEMETE